MWWVVIFGASESMNECIDSKTPNSPWSFLSFDKYSRSVHFFSSHTAPHDGPSCLYRARQSVSQLYAALRLVFNTRTTHRARRDT